MRHYGKVTPWTSPPAADSDIRYAAIKCMIAPSGNAHVHTYQAQPTGRLADAEPLEAGAAIDKAIKQLADARGLDVTANYKALFDEVMVRSPDAKAAYAKVPARQHQQTRPIPTSDSVRAWARQAGLENFVEILTDAPPAVLQALETYCADLLSQKHGVR